MWHEQSRHDPGGDGGDHHPQRAGDPEDLARWLACEVLLGDTGALGDDELANGLIRFQDRLSDLTRVRYGIPVGKIPPS